MDHRLGWLQIIFHSGGGPEKKHPASETFKLYEFTALCYLLVLLIWGVEYNMKLRDYPGVRCVIATGQKISPFSSVFDQRGYI